MTVTIPDVISERLLKEAAGLNMSIEQRVSDILDNNGAPGQNLNSEYLQQGLEKIQSLLRQIPCTSFISISSPGAAYWWVKFGINIHSPIAWIVVQELGHILNYLSANDKLPTIFYPVSPPPYLNGGPDQFLSWIIEPTIPYVDTNNIYNFLHGRLPEEYDKEKSWFNDDEA